MDVKSRNLAGEETKKLIVHQSRLRRAHEGELIKVDGSPHDRFEGRSEKCTLL